MSFRHTVTTPFAIFSLKSCRLPADTPESFWKARVHTRIPANFMWPPDSRIMSKRHCLRFSRGRLAHSKRQFLGYQYNQTIANMSDAFSWMCQVWWVWWNYYLIALSHLTMPGWARNGHKHWWLSRPVEHSPWMSFSLAVRHVRRNVKKQKAGQKDKFYLILKLNI